MAQQLLNMDVCFLLGWEGKYILGPAAAAAAGVNTAGVEWAYPLPYCEEHGLCFAAWLNCLSSFIGMGFVGVMCASCHASLSAGRPIFASLVHAALVQDIKRSVSLVGPAGRGEVVSHTVPVMNGSEKMSHLEAVDSKRPNQ